MNFMSQTILLYVLFGVGVAAAVGVNCSTRGFLAYYGQILCAFLFWPIFVPLLLDGHSRRRPLGHRIAPAADGIDTAIAQVDAELEAAINSLDGWASDVLTREKKRLDELRFAWTVQAERIREMDRLLNSTADALSDEQAIGPENSSNCDRLNQSLRARQQNFARLRQVKQRAHDDLMGTLAWVRELVSMIHLAKFTGAPASRAEELVAQIAASVEGLSAATWKEEVYA